MRESCQDSGQRRRGKNHHRRGHQFADAREQVRPESQGGRLEKSPERLPRIKRTENSELDVTGDKQICTPERVHHAGLGVPEEENRTTTAKTKEQVIHEKKSVISNVSRTFTGEDRGVVSRELQERVQTQEDWELLTAIQIQRQQVTILELEGPR